MTLTSISNRKKNTDSTHGYDHKRKKMPRCQDTWPSSDMLREVGAHCVAQVRCLHINEKVTREKCE